MAGDHVEHVDATWRPEIRDLIHITTSVLHIVEVCRDSCLNLALFRSAYALSVAIALGIDFVAKTESFFCSHQHSL